LVGVRCEQIEVALDENGARLDTNFVTSFEQEMKALAREFVLRFRRRVAVGEE